MASSLPRRDFLKPTAAIAAIEERRLGLAHDRRLQAQGIGKVFCQGYKNGDSSLRLILGRLNASTCPQDMNLPGLSLHELKGDRKGTWAVKVSGNWRVTFCFVGEDATDVDYEDYH